jgi:hypothetical protein
MKRTWITLAVAVLVALAARVPGRADQPVVFDGLGLENFEGGGSIAAELRQLEAEERRAGQAELPRLTVAAPVTGRDAAQVPLTAELRSRIEGFDVAAALVADARMVSEGPARWMGKVGVANVSDEGRESLELRTILGNNAEWGLVGVEVGPRIERRLRRGATFFIDGKAEAQARRSAETGLWSMPGTSTDGASMVGVAARTGLVR